MNTPPIPPTNRSGLPLVSVGNGNTVKWGKALSSTVSNQAWAAAVSNVTGVTAGSYQTPSGLSVTVSGSSSYLLQAVFFVKNNDASSRTINTRFYQGTTAYSSAIGYVFTTGMNGTISNATVVSGLNQYQSYTFNGQVNFPGSAGTVYSATITAIGLG